MSTHLKIIISVIVAISGIWFITELETIQITTEWLAWRSLTTQYTGILSIILMSVSMLLAIRPVIIESYLNGLDKLYKLHKWIGISGFTFGIIHWIITQLPKWMTMLGILERKGRPPRPNVIFDNVIQQFFQTQRGFAESIGEWAFYIFSALIIITLAKKIFSYTKFIKTHHIMAIIYLVLVWHSIVLLKFTYWNSTIGIILAGFITTGSISAIIVLLHKIGKRRTHLGNIKNIKINEESKIITLSLTLDTPITHKSGQFAFLTLNEKEGAHPFTISSAGNKTNQTELEFKIKKLGDYTNTFVETIKIGDHVKVEGPYGKFTLNGEKKHQIWIAGGIGITPFLSKLKELSDHKLSSNIYLFYTTKIPDPFLIEELKKYAANTGIKLHISIDEHDGLLTADKIIKMIPAWKQADIWFCGPETFGNVLKHDFIKNGLQKKNYHVELFEFR